jgi:hypothetical protein
MTYRLTVTFKGLAAQRLEKLSVDRSKSDVLCEALAIEEIYRDALHEGGTLVVKDKDGTEHLIVRAS